MNIKLFQHSKKQIHFCLKSQKQRKSIIDCLLRKQIEAELNVYKHFESFGSYQVLIERSKVYTCLLAVIHTNSKI